MKSMGTLGWQIFELDRMLSYRMKHTRTLSGSLQREFTVKRRME